MQVSLSRSWKRFSWSCFGVKAGVHSPSVLMRSDWLLTGFWELCYWHQGTGHFMTYWWIAIVCEGVSG